MCEPGPAGDVGGMLTMLTIPAKLTLRSERVWQVSQPLDMPWWLIEAPPKLEPLMTGRLAIRVPVPV